MKKTTILTGTILAMSAAPILATDILTTDTPDTNLRYEQNSNERYRANEFSLDAFGTASVGQQTLNHISGHRINQDTRLGAGLGVNYFFCRYVGIGAEGYTENTAHNFVDNASGNLIGRLPLGHSGLAPYIFGGAGHKFDPVNITFGQAGGGLEYRFTPNIGLFVDARYVFANKIANYGVGRAGLRFAF